MSPEPQSGTRPRLSVVMIARNEAWRIRASLESAAFADELLVADTASTDGTAQVAKSCGARVIDLPFEGYGATKQMALEAATGEWALVLDADEVITPELKASIQEVVVQDGPFDGYLVQRRAWFLGKPMAHGGWGRDRVLRLVRRARARFTESKVHERLEVTGRTGSLAGLLDHHTDPSFPRYLAKIDRYSSLAAQELAESGKSVNLGTALLHGTARFFKQYLMKRGYRDGVHGALLALTSGYSVALRHLKARLLRMGNGEAILSDTLHAERRDPS